MFLTTLDHYREIIFKYFSERHLVILYSHIMNNTFFKFVLSRYCLSNHLLKNKGQFDLLI